MERFLIKKLRIEKSKQTAVENDNVIEDNSNSNKKRKNSIETEEVSISTLVNSSDSNVDEGEELDILNEPEKSRQFRKQWLDNFVWLEERNGKAFCIPCEKYIINIKTHLDRHENTPRHKANIKEIVNQPKIDNINFNSEKSQKKENLKKAVRNAELCLIMFCLMHHLPFRLMDYLPSLLEKCCPDSTIAKNIKCARTKSTNILCNELAKRGERVMSNELKKRKFAIIVDETTDVSCTKALVIVARFFDYEAQSVKDKFLGLLKLVSCNSQDIYYAIINYLKELDIPITNLIGLATDNASVMAGHLNGLQSKLKVDCPHLFYMKCICHSLHLCASHACKLLPSNIEHMARNIYNFFSHSAKRVAEFEEFQEYCELKFHKILNVAPTRWLSMLNVVDRILEQWTALKLYFISCKLETYNLVNAGELAEALNSKNKLYFLFLSNILKITNNMNIEFQSQNLRIHRLYDVMSTNFKLILSNFLQIEYINSLPCLSQVNLKNKNNHLSINDIYIGGSCEKFILEDTSGLSNEDILEVKEASLNFYIKLCEEIMKRFDFGEQVFKSLSLIDPEKATSSTESLGFLLSRFPNLACTSEEKDNSDKIDAEWRLLKFQALSEKSFNINPEIFWNNLKNLKNAFKEPLFENLADFMINLMSLPHSSACAERVFSDLNLIKNKKTNRLNLETIRNIMLAKEIPNVRNAIEKQNTWSPPENW